MRSKGSRAQCVSAPHGIITTYYYDATLVALLLPARQHNTHTHTSHIETTHRQRQRQRRPHAGSALSLVCCFISINVSQTASVFVFAVARTRADSKNVICWYSGVCVFVFVVFCVGLVVRTKATKSLHTFSVRHTYLFQSYSIYGHFRVYCRAKCFSGVYVAGPTMAPTHADQHIHTTPILQRSVII